MRRIWFLVVIIGVAIAATLVPLRDATLDLILFVALTVFGVIVVRVFSIGAIPRWAPALMLLFTGLGHVGAFAWVRSVYPESGEVTHLSRFAIAYLVVGIYLWVTGRLQYRRAE